ncbi:MAG: tetratricopeptide repeat protein [Nevskia sp.]|nr:tetratricopeptide repeat protein [Nevskia sp.]
MTLQLRKNLHGLARRLLLPLLVVTLAVGCSGTARKPTPAPVVSKDVGASADAAAVKRSDNKGDPDARFSTALKLLKDRQVKEAREAFLQLAKDFPQYSGPFTDLAIIQYQSKQPDLAVANFEKAARLNPENAVAWNWLGLIAREGRDYAKAESAYVKALEIKPDYAAAHFNLAVLHDLYTRRPAEALQHYREYQRLTGGDRLIVAAWIKELEAQAPQPTAAAAPAATGATR